MSIMVEEKKSKTNLPLLGWIISAVLIITLTVFGINHISNKEEKSTQIENEKIISDLFDKLDANYQMTVLPDAKASYVDSLNAYKSARAQVIEEAIIKQISEQLTKEAQVNATAIENNTKTLFIWGAILALSLHIMLLLIYMELRKQAKPSRRDEYLEDFAHTQEYHQRYQAPIVTDETSSPIAPVPAPIVTTENEKTEHIATKPVAPQPIVEVVEETIANVTETNSHENNTELATDYNDRLLSVLNMESNVEKLEMLEKLASEIENETNLTSDDKDALLYQTSFYLAQSLHLNNNDKEAIEIYSKLIDTNAEQPRVYFERGNTYLSSLEPDKAIEDYNKAIEIMPDYTEAYLNRGLAYMAKEDYEMAIKDFDNVTNSDVDNVKAIYNKSIAYFKKKNYQEALDKLENLLRIEPDNTKAYNLRGLIYTETGETHQAIEDFGKAIEMDPQYTEAYRNSGIAYSQLSEYNLAIFNFDKAIELDPQNTDIFYDRGNAYLHLQEYSKAVSDFDKVLDIDPFNIDLNTKKGISCFEQGQYTSAMSCLKNVIRLSPDHKTATEYIKKIEEIEKSANDNLSEAKAMEEDFGNTDTKNNDSIEEVVAANTSDAATYFDAATAYFDDNNFEKAIEQFSKSIELDNENAQAYYMRGLSYSYIRDFDAAITDFNQSLDLSPGNADVYYNRGNAYTNKQQYDDAIKDYSESVSISPQIPEAFFNRANIFYNLGQYDSAIEDYTSAITINPQYIKAFFNRALAHKTNKQYANSVEDFEQVKRLDPDNVRLIEKAQRQIDNLRKLIDKE